MDAGILDEALRLLLARDVPISHENLYADPARRRIHELRRRFPDADIVAASQRADELLDAACELVESSRGPANYHTPVEVATLAVRCPGFSPASYEAAVSQAYLLTR